MSRIADIALAPAGEIKIKWVERNMPVLRGDHVQCLRILVPDPEDRNAVLVKCGRPIVPVDQHHADRIRGVLACIAMYDQIMSGLKLFLTAESGIPGYILQCAGDPGRPYCNTGLQI